MGGSNSEVSGVVIWRVINIAKETPKYIDSESPCFLILNSTLHWKLNLRNVNYWYVVNLANSILSPVRKTGNTESYIHTPGDGRREQKLMNKKAPQPTSVVHPELANEISRVLIVNQSVTRHFLSDRLINYRIY